MIRWAMVLGVLLIATSAAAQGRSGEAPGRNKSHGPGGGPEAASPATSSPAVTPLSSWLDDASSLGRGQAWLGFSFARWSAEGATVWFAPSTFVMAGLSDRIGAGASVPMYHVRDAGGAATRGIGDVTLFGKLGLVNPETRAVGLAVAPVIVIAQDASTSSGRRVAWAIPVSLERRFGGGRAYGSAGYFSSGGTFFNTALELAIDHVWSLGSTFGASFATGVDPTVATASSHRVDISASLLAAPSSNLALSFSIGHSYSGNVALDGGPWFAAGVAIKPPKR